MIQIYFKVLKQSQGSSEAGKGELHKEIKTSDPSLEKQPWNEWTNTKLQGTARISITEIYSRATPARGKQRGFLMGMCREKGIHLLRQFSILLPPLSPKQRSASCAMGKAHWLCSSLCQGKQQHHFQHITTACLCALLWRAGWENKFLQDFAQVGLGMMAPVPLPSWEQAQLHSPATGLASLNPPCIPTKLPPTSKQLLFFMPLLYKSAFLVLWSRDREKWDGSQLKFAGTLCDLL